MKKSLLEKLAFPVLIGDIGGTNARFQILPDATSEPVPFAHVRTSSFTTIEEAIEKGVLQDARQMPRTALLAAAGPITANGLDLTNCGWNIRPDSFLGLGEFENLVLFNDFGAQALALPSLQEPDLVAIGGANARQIADATKVVLGPGTGLGVGILAKAPNQWIPLGGEGGHVDLGPRNDREEHVWKNLSRFEGRVSAESVLRGPGLVNLYTAICQTDEKPVIYDLPEDISAAALQGDDLVAAETLSMFCVLLGRVAGDLALTVLPRGGVYIGGGIARQIEPFLLASEFRQAFEDKAPHSELMRAIPTLLITHEVPALLGLAAFARNPASFGIDLEHRCWSR